ncbi:substrate-binding domain-containing protein [Nocardia veterana]|uniref:ABC transporter substrate-binding protein n=1 Tax=Nocardia veterana TaxID=132249 RepID=A0A7X6LTH9_9NOCA|nr:substrate-binding domain-containing protein [Nocardia veterana]NKY84182.1 ABC transporter substrate-binding protein [Nocardia veterana]
MFSFGESPDEVVEVLNIVPLQGPVGIVAPSCEAAISLAAKEINSGTGILGREVRVTTIDGGRRPAEVAEEVSALLATGMIDAITGWHISAVRQAVARVTGGRVPYLFANVYEELPNEPAEVVMIGEAPSGHILPAMRWLAREFGTRRWAIVGNDYIWPVATGRDVRAAYRRSIVYERYVPLGTRDFGDILADPGFDRADGIVMLLVGMDAVRFNQQFTRTGRAADQLRVSPVIDEQLLLAAGPAAHANLYVASSLFPDTSADPDRPDRYHRMHGRFAPKLTYFGNTAYEALHTLRAMAHAVGSLEVPRLRAALDEGLLLETPSGGRMYRDNHVVRPPSLIARADGVDLRILDTLY